MKRRDGKIARLLQTSQILALCATLGAAVAAPPYANSTYITGVSYNQSTIKTAGPGSDNWATTWHSNGHQYSSFGDGGGFGGTNSTGRVSLGLTRIEGDFPNFTGKNVWGGANAENPAQFEGKCYGIIAIGSTMYKWVSPGSCAENYASAALYRSTDNGAHWSKTGPTFTKGQDLIIPAILQYGKGYAGGPDYVYHYFLNNAPANNSECLQVQKPGKIYLARVPKGSMTSGSAYQFVSGFNSDGSPSWSSSTNSKKPVFQDNNGVGWNLSVSYNAGLNRYILITENTEALASNYGMFEAPEPWGPWKTITYGKFYKAQSFYWNFSNKWTQGKDFVLIYTGYKASDAFYAVKGTFTVSGVSTMPANSMDKRQEARTGTAPISARLSRGAVTLAGLGSGNYSVKVLSSMGRTVAHLRGTAEAGVSTTHRLDAVGVLTAVVQQGNSISRLRLVE